MRVHAVELCNGKSKPHSIQTSLLLLTLILIFLTIIPLYLLNHSQSPEPKPSPKIGISGLRSVEKVKECDVFSGRWIPYSKGPYYTNETCRLIIDQQNCMKFGRPDTEFMKWRWRPEECELPFFNAMEFLELVRGKFMAFVGDSVGRNQMQSLLCLLSSVAYPEDISHKYTSDETYFKRWFYSEYKFTLATLWSPFLVRAQDADANGHSLNSLMSLHLDKVDEAWASQIENFDYVIISAGQWFFRPLIYYINDQIVGCHNCNQEDITSVTKYYGYRMAFRTAFKTLQKRKNYKGMTILRTFSPSHFENGAWNEGGSCERTRPFTNQEKKLDGYTLEFYLTQVEELRKAEREGRKKGLKLRLLATTEAMLLRPDGHPNRYGHSRALERNTTIPDCVHWCLPGPVDTWNELLLYMLKREAWRFSVRRN
ncbi:hypothetical protein K2173_026057 [Erythroxylum novogranatense]|uniref:Trichome birefringence-like N-terminal domain-containing protein n=1 Tax=Erythroxylum novogranatense TaxID=1862640 RepID=A0AAV8SI50_9ROSI|nr:hypothetical protein K2173_026057 [Erythroxylum novogranatense]